MRGRRAFGRVACDPRCSPSGLACERSSKTHTSSSPTASTAVSVVIDGARIADIDPAPQLRVDEVDRRRRAAPAARRHRRPGPLPRAGPDAQGRPGHGQPRLCQGRRHDVSRNAEHRAARRRRRRGSRKSSPWRPTSRSSTTASTSAPRCDNLDELKRAHRTPGIKIFIGSSTGDLLVDDQAALERIFAETTLPITAHCEDETTVRANAARLAGTHDVADHSRIRDHAGRAHRHAPGDRSGPPAPASLPRAARFDRRGNRAAGRSSQPDHRRGLPAPFAVQHRRLRPPRHARADESVAENAPTTTGSCGRRSPTAGCRSIATDHAPHTLEEKQRPYPPRPPACRPSRIRWR